MALLAGTVKSALELLSEAGIHYQGWIPNFDVPDTFARFKLTLHIPRRPYVELLQGIPTIRVFEALACGIPLISAPWRDSEQLFRDGDFCKVRNANEACAAIEALLSDEGRARQQAERGLEVVLNRHTCMHRAEELTAICEELFR